MDLWIINKFNTIMLTESQFISALQDIDNKVVIHITRRGDLVCLQVVFSDGTSLKASSNNYKYNESIIEDYKKKNG